MQIACVKYIAQVQLNCDKVTEYPRICLENHVIPADAGGRRT